MGKPVHTYSESVFVSYVEMWKFQQLRDTDMLTARDWFMRNVSLFETSLHISPSVECYQ